MEIPPSFNTGVTNSARYNQIWGISIAMSSANSNVSEKLKKEQEENSHTNIIQKLRLNKEIKNQSVKKYLLSTWYVRYCFRHKVTGKQVLALEEVIFVCGENENGPSKSILAYRANT